MKYQEWATWQIWLMRLALTVGGQIEGSGLACRITRYDPKLLERQLLAGKWGGNCEHQRAPYNVVRPAIHR